MIETPAYYITQSMSHDGMWIFKVKKDGSFFSINADEVYIRMNYDEDYM